MTPTPLPVGRTVASTFVFDMAPLGLIIRNRNTNNTITFMSVAIDWHAVQWHEFIRRYSETTDINTLIPGADEDEDEDQDEGEDANEGEDQEWLRRLDLDRDWLCLLEDWDQIQEFNDDLIDCERRVHDKLSKLFPCLVACGVLWDAEELSPSFPMDVKADSSGCLVGALSPETVRSLHAQLTTLDRKKLRALIEPSEIINDPERFDGAENFLALIEALTELFEDAASENAGIIVTAA